MEEKAINPARRIVLGSTSPYRKALLNRLKIPFVTAAPDIDESPLPNESPRAMVLRLTEAKAREIAKIEQDALIIAGDQVAVCGDLVFGKPGDRATAIGQLQQASGRALVFETGLCVLDSAANTLEIEVVPFTVLFRTLTLDQIEWYLDKEDALNCAGSFRSEGLGISLCERLEGEDPSTLIGLPLIRLTRMLERSGVRVV